MSLDSILNPFTGQIDFIGSSTAPANPSQWKDPVTDNSQLPLLGNAAGDARVTLDNNHINIWNGTAWVDISSTSNIYKTEKIVLTSTHITNKGLTLDSIPEDDSKVRLVVIGGIEQDNGVDFTVSGQNITWNGQFLESVLESGMKLVISYN